MSGGHSKSSSKSQSQQSTQVWGQQAPYLQQLYGQGAQLQGEQMPQAQAMGNTLMQGAQGDIVGGGLGALGSMAQGDSAIGQSLNQRASGQQNPYLQGNINALGQNIQQQLGIQMQGLGGQAGLAGQMGGGRQGVAEGLAVQGAQREFSQGANQMLSQDYMNQGQYAQEALGFQQGALGGYMGGLGQQFNLGMQGLGGAWNPMMMQSGLLGPAIMESQGTSGSKAYSFAMQGGMF